MVLFIKGIRFYLYLSGTLDIDYFFTIDIKTICFPRLILGTQYKYERLHIGSE